MELYPLSCVLWPYLAVLWKATLVEAWGCVCFVYMAVALSTWMKRRWFLLLWIINCSTDSRTTCQCLMPSPYSIRNVSRETSKRWLTHKLIGACTFRISLLSYTYFLPFVCVCVCFLCCQTFWWTCWESWPATASQSRSWSCSLVCWGAKTASG